MLLYLKWLYVLAAIAMIAASLFTGRRATAMSGRPHYMLTRTSVLAMEEVPAENAGDAAFDAAMREAGESPAIPVEKPCFVLGFADATGPFILAGGSILLVAHWWKRRGAARPRAIAKS